MYCTEKRGQRWLDFFVVRFSLYFVWFLVLQVHLLCGNWYLVVGFNLRIINTTVYWTMSKIQDVLSKMGKGGPAMNAGVKLLATVGAIGYGLSQSFYTGMKLWLFSICNQLINKLCLKIRFFLLYNSGWWSSCDYLQSRRRYSKWRVHRRIALQDTVVPDSDHLWHSIASSQNFLADRIERFTNGQHFAASVGSSGRDEIAAHLQDTRPRLRRTSASLDLQRSKCITWQWHHQRSY